MITVNELRYPQLKADLNLCIIQLGELCSGKHDKAFMSVPPRTIDFDMQMSAAFDELKAYRDIGTPAEITALQEGYATLTKALEIAVDRWRTDLGPKTKQKVVDYFIQQAKDDLQSAIHSQEGEG